MTFQCAGSSIAVGCCGCGGQVGGVVTGLGPDQSVPYRSGVGLADACLVRVSEEADARFRPVQLEVCCTPSSLSGGAASPLSSAMICWV